MSVIFCLFDFKYCLGWVGQESPDFSSATWRPPQQARYCAASVRTQTATAARSSFNGRDPLAGADVWPWAMRTLFQST
ncbi:hypothetical protein [Pandoravirus japonicus]|uniref:Uncharacterized protein n=1 Tax=Pandoravirus japonicus TaxID=2823154 RepID=A0A811BNS2_9VIRU|nr:hypothetical protein [Pandoravirus japonicus]